MCYKARDPQSSPTTATNECIENEKKREKNEQQQQKNLPSLLCEQQAIDEKRWFFVFGSIIVSAYKLFV